MQHLDTLWKVISAAGTVRDLAQERKTYQFTVQPPLTLYMHTDHAVVHVKRWLQHNIEIRTRLDAGFGYRIRTDQDEAGVYLVAKRRAVVGSVARGQFMVFVPQHTHLIMKIEHGALFLDHLHGTLHVPPMADDGIAYLESGKI